MHLKRQQVPKSWPSKRKGTKFVVRPNFAPRRGLPILIILKELLKIVQNRKEAKKIIHEKKVLLNTKFVRDEKNSALIFDTITLVPLKKSYILDLSERGKFNLTEIKNEEADKKISKVTNKKILRGKKTQINLNDGRNIISNLKCNTNDSVIINLKDKKIERCLPLKEKAKVFVFAGKHSGMRGSIIKLDLEKKMAELEVNERKINVLIKQLMVIEK